mgnify:CR=1 FL=1
MVTVNSSGKSSGVVEGAYLLLAVDNFFLVFLLFGFLEFGFDS